MNLIEYVNKKFPLNELSYDKLHHKKVPNCFLAIPKGKKYYLWFTNMQNEDVCILIEYHNKSQSFVRAEKIQTYFSREMSYGSILYGTIVIHKHCKYFVCENVLQHRKNFMANAPYKRVLQAMNDIFTKDIECKSITGHELIVTSCLMSTSKETLKDLIQNQTYPIYGILNRCLQSTYTFMTPYDNKSSNITNARLLTFRVMADIKHNVYKLYYYEPNKGIQFYQKTYIPDHATTVMMNNKFRIVKEDTNLDLLEESDDEEEFENIDEDKFVFLDRYCNFKCYFHPKIKRWVPKECTNDKHIANAKDIKPVNTIY